MIRQRRDVLEVEHVSVHETTKKPTKNPKKGASHRETPRKIIFEKKFVVTCKSTSFKNNLLLFNQEIPNNEEKTWFWAKVTFFFYKTKAYSKMYHRFMKSEREVNGKEKKEIECPLMHKLKCFLFFKVIAQLSVCLKFLSKSAGEMWHSSLKA